MINCHNVKVGHNSENILIENVNFNFTLADYPKRIILIVGENGIGKTTFLKTLATLLGPVDGKVEIDKLSDISYLNAETLNLFAHLRGREILDFFESLNGAKVFNRLYEVELFLKVLETKYSAMSSGMKQLLKLAISITENKKIILWDEPFKSLSEKNKDVVFELIKEFSKDRIFLITSHEKISLDTSDVHLLKISKGKIEMKDDL